MIDREALAWAAGFFDGEGSTSLARSKKQPNSPSLCVSVGQIGFETLTRFQNAVGGLGHIYHVRTVPGTYAFRACKFEHAQAIVAMLWTFVSSVKKEQALNAMRGYHEAPRQPIHLRKRDWHGRLT